MQQTQSRYRARSERRKNPGIWRLPLALSGSSPVTLRREKAYLPETVVPLGPKFLATIGSSPAREAGVIFRCGLPTIPMRICQWTPWLAAQR